LSTHGGDRPHTRGRSPNRTTETRYRNLISRKGEAVP
jgi:hypothetical protein